MNSGIPQQIRNEWDMSVFSFTFRAQATDFPKEFFSIQKIDTSLEDMVFVRSCCEKNCRFGLLSQFYLSHVLQKSTVFVKKTWDFCCLTYIQ